MENYELKQVDYFDDLNLKSDLLRGIYSYGYERPSDIQRKAILPILQGFNIIAQGQSGTGKSAAFIIPVLQIIDNDISDNQAIIFAPTQDLALQIFNVTKFLAEFLLVSVYLCKETTSLDDCEGFQILVGTPENILNLLKLGNIRRSTLKILVLDEADELIGGSHKEETKEIFSEYMDENVQVALFSTTMPDDMLPIARKYARKPLMILIPKEELMLDRISQYYVTIDEKESKSEALLELMKELSFLLIIIYCNEKETVNQVGEILSKDGIECLKIDHTTEFAEREKRMKKFRTGETRVLVTTNILSRGIDIQQVNLVVSYDLPVTKEEYIHRIGRANRFSKRGYVINFVTPKETQELNEIEKYYNIKLELLEDFNSFH